jgi:hypothetical protein
MEFKKLLTPFVLIGLFAFFAFVCAMVWLHKGKSAKWVARKMKIGAAILSLTAIVSGCNDNKLILTCYDVAEPNQFSFDSINEQYEVEADLPADSVLTGSVFDIIYDDFKFKVQKNDSVTVDSGKIVPTDGAYDENTEEFKMTLNSQLDTGLYQLLIQGEENAETVNVTTRSLRIK